MAAQIRISLPPETLAKLDAARGNVSRSAYIRWCLSDVTGSFERDGISAGHRAYLMAFEQHLRSEAGIDTALEIARCLGVKLSGGHRQNRPTLRKAA